MILRAIFWIGLVSVLMPHEPDLGFGRPGGPLGATPTSIGSLIQASGVESTCDKSRDACSTGLSLLGNFTNVAIRSMDQVRADLAANRTKLH